MSDLASALLARAYVIDGGRLDTVAHDLGAPDWSALTSSLTFSETGTGGGSQMLCAETTTGHLIGLTDGEAGLPTTPERFWLGVMDEAGESEVYELFVEDGRRDESRNM